MVGTSGIPMCDTRDCQNTHPLAMNPAAEGLKPANKEK